MTYIEACRVAEENANWIRNHDVERIKRLADLETAQGIIAKALSIEPKANYEKAQPAAAVFVHPDDERPATYEDAHNRLYAVIEDGLPNGAVSQ